MITDAYSPALLRMVRERFVKVHLVMVTTSSRRSTLGGVMNWAEETLGDWRSPKQGCSLGRL
jgi:hypothetical protein